MSCLLRRPKRFVPRRKKAIAGSSRTYSSKTRTLQQAAAEDATDPPESVANGFETQREEDGEDTQKRAKDDLNTLLDQKGQTKYDDAWMLYTTAGYPLDLNPTLLAYLCQSRRPHDNDRSKQLFDGIAVEGRSSDDYLHMSMSNANASRLLDLKRTTQEAVANGVGGPSWSFTFARLLDTERLSDAQGLWDSRPQGIDNEWVDLVAGYLDPLSLPKSILALANFIVYQRNDASMRQTSALIDFAFASPRIVENTPTETLLLLLRRYRDLGILHRDQYCLLIETLASVANRSTFVKSIVIYRNFRWQMNSEIPPAAILRRILRGLVNFRITSGVRYILNEIAFFYRKPSLGDYRIALNAFARVGDVAQVNEVFESQVKDHGKRILHKNLDPLLYVHARVGNAQSAHMQFERLSKDFGLEPNAVWWNILLTAHMNNDDLDGTLSTFDKMLRNGVQPDSYSFGILMGICANRGDIDNVLRLLGMVKERRVQITTPLLDPIVESYCNNQLYDLAELVAEACLGLEVKGSLVRMWNLLLWNHAFRIDLESVARIRSRMEAAGIQPDSMSYAALMLSLVLVGKPDAARRILRTLHRGRRIHATEFHYAIILFGYVKSRNRDMVHVLFREINERFSRPGFSSRLLVLRSQLQRDLQQMKGGRLTDAATTRLEHAEKFLMETIAGSDITMLGTEHPSPGTGKQSLREAFPSMYYEYVIAAYGTIGASHRVKTLFEEFTNSEYNLSRGSDASNLPPLRLLWALMLTHLNAGQFDKVEECWTSAFPLAVKMAGRRDVDEWISAHSPSMAAPKPPPLPDASRSGSNLLGSSGAGESRRKTAVLPSYRFLLSRALSLYMRSLAHRRETWKIAQVVTQVENAGFALTSFNLSTYVQLLCSSQQPTDQVKAFSIFEEKFMPNYPGWRHLVRGRAIKPPGAPRFTNVMEKRIAPPHLFGKEARKAWSKIHPDYMHPTYVTMVYLASALQGFRDRSIAAGNSEVKVLYEIAPRTIDAIADMPYLREKYQGVLLRGRQLQDYEHGDNEQRQPFVWTGGVLGVGGRTRTAKQVEQEEQETDEPSEVEDDSSASDDCTEQVTAPPVEEDGAPAPREPTLDTQDEHDIEAETRLEARRRTSDASDDQLDVEEPEPSGEDFLPDEEPPSNR